MTEVEKMIRALQRAVKNLEELTIEVPDIPDAAGDVRAIEVRLQALRKDWNELAVTEAKDPESEFGPETLGPQEPEKGQFGGMVRPRVTGQRYRTVEKSGPTKRTYNTAAILYGIHRAPDATPVTPIEALMWCIEQKVATIKWNWTPLKKVAGQLGLPMRIVKHEIADDGDLDAAWVGEEHSTITTQEPITGVG